MKRLPIEEQVRRDVKIIEDRNKGMIWKDIARKYKLSKTQVQNIYELKS